METTPGIDIIRAERLRQITDEGYNAPHDAKHNDGALGDAAVCYAVVGSATVRGSSAAEWPAEMLDGMGDTILDWPWDEKWWKPSNDPVRNFAKAGALIAAEIDRVVEERSKKGLKTKIPATPSDSQQKSVGIIDRVGDRPCVVCKRATNVVFNIDLQATPICESCANSITQQQVAALCSPAASNSATDGR